jgi:hypothetical protein
MRSQPKIIADEINLQTVIENKETAEIEDFKIKWALCGEIALRIYDELNVIIRAKEPEKTITGTDSIIASSNSLKKRLDAENQYQPKHTNRISRLVSHAKESFLSGFNNAMEK